MTENPNKNAGKIGYIYLGGINVKIQHPDFICPLADHRDPNDFIEVTSVADGCSISEIQAMRVEPGIVVFSVTLESADQKDLWTEQCAYSGDYFIQYFPRLHKIAGERANGGPA